MKTALVTGSAGFVGRHIVTALANRGYQITGIDIAPGPDLLFADDHDVYQHDCRDVFRNLETRFDLVVHCAAVVGGRAMIDGEPLRLAAEDLSIDAELFRWALRTRPGRIVYFSSSAAYPVHYQRRYGARPLRECDLPGREWGDWTFLSPDATYGWVKLTGERLAAEANVEGIPTHVFRPFSGYGADQDPAYPFPAIMQRARIRAQIDVADRAGGTPADQLGAFTVWGDPQSARDWIHIDDIVGAVLAAIDHDVLGPVNLCTGRPTTFAELATLALAAAGAQPGIPIKGDETKPAGVFWRVGDPTAMLEFYQPKVTLEEGIARAMETDG